METFLRLDLVSDISSTPIMHLPRDHSSVVDPNFGDNTKHPVDPVNFDGLDPKLSPACIRTHAFTPSSTTSGVFNKVPDFTNPPPDNPPIPIAPDIDVAEPIPNVAITQLAQAIARLACHASRPPPPPSSALQTKCELNFQDHPLAFASDHAKVIFAQSYLKGMVLDWFKPDLLFDQNPLLHPHWMNTYQEFVSLLTTRTMFKMSMKDGQ
ncbi:uncharacterized protein EI90DRAFT_3122609 [Cantharellus anzutake]|uniref:uncharacterized protein n=1 Tax=Cantharellus anzutake TaxID=1750568 RepID=UPI001904F74D|nr:uncharacterized protein EI90DRAFT_3122609 [Cantharellus anzutake]KAF8332855.1 hypothetical protein EI90DRAFT_3122609 [Cantharellus anzutake]